MLLGRQTQAAHVAEASVAGRVTALERYAAEVQSADTAWHDWQHAAAIAELEGQHLDMLARTAADQHGLAQIEVMTQQARAIQSVLREPPGRI
jgi:thioesterase domain-containing protein